MYAINCFSLICSRKLCTGVKGHAIFIVLTAFALNKWLTFGVQNKQTGCRWLQSASAPNRHHLMRCCEFNAVYEIICSPTPRIVWSRLGSSRRFLLGPRFRLSHNGTRLTINNVTLADQNKYTCTGSNLAGSSNVTINLIVHGKFKSIPELIHQVSVQ